MDYFNEDELLNNNEHEEPIIEEKEESSESKEIEIESNSQEIVEDVVSNISNGDEFNLEENKEEKETALEEQIINEENIEDKEVNNEDDLHEQIIEETVEKNYIDEIKNDKLAYADGKSNYRKWLVRSFSLKDKSSLAFNEVNNIVTSFLEKIKDIVENLEEKDKKLIENRVKGINMINKMSQNAVKNGLNKIITEEVYIEHIDTSFENKSEEEIKNMFNENFSIINKIQNEKSNVIKNFFEFIQNSLLPIIDGINSGISFVENSKNEVISKEILPVYKDLNDIFDDLLSMVNVKEIVNEQGTTIDFTKNEVLDIEYTEDEALDETIESVIRSGYEYLEDVYNTGEKYIIRQAQVIAYKRKVG